MSMKDAIPHLHAAVKHAGLGVADEDWTVRQARPGFAEGGAVEPKSADVSIDGTAPLDGLGQFVKRQRPVGYRGFGHGDVLDQVRELSKGL